MLNSNLNFKDTGELKPAKTSICTNVKALTDHPAYIAEGVTRIKVPADKVSWDVPFSDYDNTAQERYVHSAVRKEFAAKGTSGWAADPEAFLNVKDVKSYENHIPASAAGEALNPGGRTGIKSGRGLLGKPGPNIAADPVIFRIDAETNELQVLLIKRKDTGEWAIPGGMVDFGELATATLKRELEEETKVELTMDDAIIVYQGYVDDPRNTDTAWMETTVATKLLEPEVSAGIKIKAGDDAKAVKWTVVDAQLFSNLYASHGIFIRQALEEIVVHKAEQLLSVLPSIKNIFNESAVH